MISLNYNLQYFSNNVFSLEAFASKSSIFLPAGHTILKNLTDHIQGIPVTEEPGHFILHTTLFRTDCLVRLLTK